MSPEEKKILIIIPALNEGRIIGRLVREIRGKYPEMPLLVVNDGSSDQTAHEAASSGARVISLPFNLGIGGAVQTGYKVAHEEDFDACIQIDGDAQHDPAFLADVLAPVLSGQADLTIGSRFLSDNLGFKSTFARRIGIRFFSALLRLITQVPLTDPTSGFRATGKKLIPQFARYYPVDFPEPEAIQMAARLGARITEVPVKMRKRLGGHSSISDLKAVYYMIKVTCAILIDTLKKKP